MKQAHSTSISAILAMALTCMAPLAYGQEHLEGPFCQLLDRTSDPIWTLDFSYTERGDVKATAGDDFALIDTGLESGLLYLRTDYGDIDVGVDFDLRIVAGDGGVDMPDQFGQFNADVSWINRYYDGWASKVEAQPGLYTDYEDLSGDDFSLPFGASIIKALNDKASAQVGLRIFPEFDRSFDPVVGIRWEISPDVLLDLFYPDSRIMFALSREFEAYAGFKIREYPEYQLEEDDDRDRFMYRETRAYLGLQQAISDSTRLMFELGAAIEREVDFDGPGSDADVDDALFIRIGLAGAI